MRTTSSVPLTQLVEYRPLKSGAGGSSPSRRTSGSSPGRGTWKSCIFLVGGAGRREAEPDGMAGPEGAAARTLASFAERSPPGGGPGRLYKGKAPRPEQFPGE